MTEETQDDKKDSYLKGYLAILQKDAIKMATDLQNATIQREAALKQMDTIVTRMEDEKARVDREVAELMSLLGLKDKQPEPEDDEETAEPCCDANKGEACNKCVKAEEEVEEDAKGIQAPGE